jgi:hypothetical protein
MSAQYIDMTAANAVLKELYDGQRVENACYQDNPFLAMVPKKTSRGGKSYPLPIQYGYTQGRSATFANAQANQTAPRFSEFQLTMAKDYSLATLDNQTLLSANNDRKAFIDIAENEIDSAMASIKNSLGSSLFRSGTGSVGQISSISSGVITLTNRPDVVQFERDMVINAAATDGATPRAALGYVISIDRSAGTVTVSATQGGSAGSPASWAANDYLLVDGDSNAKLKGLSAWVPFTAPSSTSFFGVDRTADIVRLGGCRYDGSSQTIEEGLQDGLSEVSLYGDGNTDIVIMNPDSYKNLVKSLGSKVVYTDLQANANVGFRGIVVDGPRGPVKVLSDRNCPALFAWGLQMNTWELGSTGPAPMILTYGKEGLEVLRIASADAAELRIGYYAQLGCKAPGKNICIKLSA